LGARVEKMLEYDLQKKVGDADPLSPDFGTFTLETRTYSQTDPEFIPRAAIIFSPNEQNAIKLLYGKAITRPSFFQNQDLFGEGVEVSLLPETIQTFEFNYLVTLSKFSLGVSVFYNILENLIYRTQLLIGGVYQTYHANVGELNTTGAEVTFRLAPSKSFFLELSGTYQSTKDQRPGFEDIEPGYSPKLLGYVKASVFLNDDISIAVVGNYVDKMETFWDESLGGRLGDPVEAYFLLGANLRVRNLFGSGAYMNFRVSNLLNEEIHYPTTSNNDWATLGTLGKGTSFLFTLGYRFIPQPQPQP
jgi:outer membrane cobalamin receptor